MTGHDGITVIAEAGVNHNGSLALALDLVDAAAGTGADFVKFQTFRTDLLVTRTAARAPYQATNTGDGSSQYDMLKAIELSPEAHLPIVERCRKRGIAFLSTPFDPSSLDFLAGTLKLPLIKLGSSELTNGPMLVAAGRTGRRFILSTGMGTLAEVRQALGALAFGYSAADGMPGPDDFDAAFTAAMQSGLLADRVSLLQCTTAYPTPPADINLRAMAELSRVFNLPVGFSDHSEGSVIAIAAAGMGARIIEKHLTLDRGLPGPDQKASLEPAEFAAMVRDIRTVETALGSAVKKPSPSERLNMEVARRSIVAAQQIARGAAFGSENLMMVRPGSGRSPFDYWQLLGRKAKRSYDAGDLIAGDE